MIVFKILLWIILGILLLALMLVLLLLFAPVTYRIDVRYDKTADIKASVRFLIVALRLEFNQERRKFKQNISIAGFKLGGHKTKEAEKKALDAVSDVISDEEKLADDTAEDEAVDAAYGGEADEAAGQNGSDKDSEDKDADSDGENAADNADVSEENAEDRAGGGVPHADYTDENEEYDLWDNDNEENPKLGERIRDIFAAVIGFIKKVIALGIKLSPLSVADRLDDMLNKLNKKLNRIDRFWRLECTVKTRAYLKKYIISVFRHIRPRKLKGYVLYGFGDPSKTGQVTGYLSLLPFVYQKGFSLTPDFYNKILEGHIYMRGHLMLGYLMRIVLNINIWRTVKVIKKLVNEA